MSQHDLLILYIILLIESKHTSKVRTIPIVRQKLYLLSRKLNVDVGFKYSFYTSLSKDFDDTLRGMYLSGLIENGMVRFPRRSYLKLTQTGRAWLEDVKKKQELLITKIIRVINALYMGKLSMLDLELLLILDVAATKVGTDDSQKILGFVRVCGWSLSVDQFTKIYKKLLALKLPYRQTYKIDTT